MSQSVWLVCRMPTRGPEVWELTLLHPRERYSHPIAASASRNSTHSPELHTSCEIVTPPSAERSVQHHRRILVARLSPPPQSSGGSAASTDRRPLGRICTTAEW